MAENRSEYVGQWVALDGDRLIAHGDNPLAFKEKIRSAGVQRPFIVHIQEDQGAYTGGWL
ncbi:MAG: DUF5678 domain-containing protein [Acidobacteriota bacterium]